MVHPRAVLRLARAPPASLCQLGVVAAACRFCRSNKLHSSRAILRQTGSPPRWPSQLAGCPYPGRSRVTATETKGKVEGPVELAADLPFSATGTGCDLRAGVLSSGRDQTWTRPDKRQEAASALISCILNRRNNIIRGGPADAPARATAGWRRHFERLCQDTACASDRDHRGSRRPNSRHEPPLVPPKWYLANQLRKQLCQPCRGACERHP